MNARQTAPGPLALIEALVNTLLDITTGEDTLDRPEVRENLGIGADDEVEKARELRESLRAACLAHAGHPPHRSVTPLSELLARGPLRVAVDERDGAASLVPVDGDSLAGRVAAAIAQARGDGTWPRLKACEAADCHWAYYDRSPAGRGRWCDMAVCGARAKMRRYRAK
ncbi:MULTISPECIES: CGNR zinc finger domain-containing protein [unclassified Streptomyces]|uniref:CGNR zinc finger domain-containing protein n=1 Tax=unclassified Streptomyces TaxID=2593676 RepID=UPI00278C1784|nr:MULTISPECIES: CGNR zinc finger domain-containing protein [unclassified Streptomyces]